MFITDLVLKEMPQPDFWAVAAPLVWFDGVLGFTVPVGALTDLASIPRIVRNIPMLDPDGESRSEAVGHDWLYRTHQLSRADADDFLRRAIIVGGGSATVARMFWAGVRLGGSGPYNAHPDGPTAADFDTQANHDAWRATDSGMLGY